MRLIIIALGLLVIGLAQAGPASAASETWQAPTPKQGTAGMLLCSGTATVNGDTYTSINYVGFDQDEPAASERAWQIKTCQRWMTTGGDVTRWFLYQRGLVVDPSEVKVSYRFLD